MQEESGTIQAAGSLCIPVRASGVFFYNDVFLSFNSRISAVGRRHEKIDVAAAGSGNGGLPDLYPLWRQSVFPEEKQRIWRDAGAWGKEEDACRAVGERGGLCGFKIYFAGNPSGSTRVVSGLEDISDIGDQYVADAVSVRNDRDTCGPYLCGSACLFHPDHGHPVCPPDGYYGYPECQP